MFHTCPEPGCGRSFPLKKTLTRHLKSVHQPSNFTCPFPSCSQTFNRKDICDRHQREQHCDPDGDVKAWCDVCRRHIHRRALDGHLNSECHKRAALSVELVLPRAESSFDGSLESTSTDVLLASEYTPLSTWPPFDTEIEPFAFAQRLWLMIGNFDRHSLQSLAYVKLPIRLSPEAMELEGRALHSLRRSLDTSTADLANSITLPQIRTMTILAIVEHMRMGWNQCFAHWKMLRCLGLSGCKAYKQYQSMFRDEQLSLLDLGIGKSESAMEGEAWLGSHESVRLGTGDSFSLCNKCPDTCSVENSRYHYSLKWSCHYSLKWNNRVSDFPDAKCGCPPSFCTCS